MAISTFIIPFIILVISYIYYSWIEIRNYDNSYSLQILSTDDSKRVRNQKNLLLVIAHPDDESMFFSPFLISLKERDDITVHVLCLSKCNDDSNVREEELKKACPILGIHEENIYFEDYVDGSDVCKKYFNFHYRLIMIIKWDPKDIADKISKHYNRLNVDIVVTFDYYGVSGHKNHIQCFNGVKNFKNNKGGKKFYKLLSSPIFLKYIVSEKYH